MPCSFCRSDFHTKRNCDNPEVAAIQVAYVNHIRNIMIQSYIREDIPIVLKRNMGIYFSRIILEHLKYIFQYLKRHTRLNITGSYILKRHIIQVICQIVFFDCGIDEEAFHISESTLSYVRNRFYSLNAITGPASLVPIPLEPSIFPEINRPPPPVPPIARPPLPVSPTARSPIPLPPTPRPPLPVSPTARPPLPTIMRAPIPVQSATTPYVPRIIISTHLKIVVLKFEEVCENNDECPICYDGLMIDSFVKLNCSHKYCKECIKKCMSSCKYDCPMCRAPITTIYTQNPVVSYSL